MRGETRVPETDAVSTRESFLIFYLSFDAQRLRCSLSIGCFFYLLVHSLSFDGCLRCCHEALTRDGSSPPGDKRGQCGACACSGGPFHESSSPFVEIRRCRRCRCSRRRFVSRLRRRLCGSSGVKTRRTFKERIKR